MAFDWLILNWLLPCNGCLSHVLHTKCCYFWRDHLNFKLNTLAFDLLKCFLSQMSNVGLLIVCSLYCIDSISDRYKSHAWISFWQVPCIIYHDYNFIHLLQSKGLLSFWKLLFYMALQNSIGINFDLFILWQRQQQQDEETSEEEDEGNQQTWFVYFWTISRLTVPIWKYTCIRLP